MLLDTKEYGCWMTDFIDVCTYILSIYFISHKKYNQCSDITC